MASEARRKVQEEEISLVRKQVRWFPSCLTCVTGRVAVAVAATASAAAAVVGASVYGCCCGRGVVTPLVASLFGVSGLKCCHVVFLCFCLPVYVASRRRVHSLAFKFCFQCPRGSLGARTRERPHSVIVPPLS